MAYEENPTALSMVEWEKKQAEKVSYNTRTYSNWGSD